MHASGDFDVENKLRLATFDLSFSKSEPDVADL
jgi:hypothetical protein